MPYTLKYLSGKQVQHIMALSKAVVSERCAGADFSAPDLAHIFEASPEEEALEAAVSDCTLDQKRELAALLQAGRSRLGNESDIIHIMDSFKNESDDALKMAITSRGKTLRVCLEQVITPSLHPRHREW